MNITIHHKHIELSEHQQDYIMEKITHLKKFGERIDDESTQVRVDVTTNADKTTNKNISMQVTMFVPHAVIRAEVMGVTVEEAIDLAEEKLKKQLERYKVRNHRRDQGGKWIPASTLEAISATQTQEEGNFEASTISKRKLLTELVPMHEEEAVEQMELLDHPFYAFKNSETNRFNVVYKRKNGTYGLLDIDM